MTIRHQHGLSSALSQEDAMEAGAYNIAEKSAAYPPYSTTLSIVEFLRQV